MTQNKAAFTLIVLVALLALSTAAVAPALKFTFKDVNAPGATETDTYAINNSKAIAGDYIDSASVQHGMILKGTKLTTADNSNCSSGIAFYGINSSGVAAGWCTGTSGSPIGFTYVKGKFKPVTIKGAVEVEADGINNSGQVVGTYFDSAGAEHGFLLTGKKLTTLNPPGVGSSATAWSINDAGVIAVYGINTAGTAYLSYTTADDGKTYQPFAYTGKGAGSLGTVIHGINNNGDITGTYFDTNSEGKGVLFHASKYYAFHDPNDCLAAPCSTRSDGINDTLGVVGRYSPSSGANQGYFAQAK